MKHLFSTKPLVAAAIALGTLGAAGMAQARDMVHDDARYPVAVGEPYGHQRPAPVDHRHDRRGGALGDADRDGIPNLYDRDSRFYDHRATRNHPEWGDFDRDGVPNKFDRAPRNSRRS
jgi:hypothetical protein